MPLVVPPPTSPLPTYLSGMNAGARDRVKLEWQANIIENNSVAEITKGYNILKRQNFTSEWTLFARQIFYKKSSQTIP